MTASLCHGLSAFRPASAARDTGAKWHATRHHQIQKETRQKKQLKLKRLVATIRPSSAVPPRAKRTVNVEGWADFPGLPVGPALVDREVSFRTQPSMRQVREQLLDCWQRSSCLQESSSQVTEYHPMEVKKTDCQFSRFAKMFDPNKLPKDFRRQLYHGQYRLPRGGGGGGGGNLGLQVCHELDIAYFEDVQFWESDVPQTPPNTPVHACAPDNSDAKRDRLSKTPTLPCSRNQRNPSLTSEAESELQPQPFQRQTTHTTDNEMPVVETERADACEESSSSACPELPEPDFSMAPLADDEIVYNDTTVEHEKRLSMLSPHIDVQPRAHWLEVQERRVGQQIRRNQVSYDETPRPRQAGGLARHLEP
ncbi:unnamed protein product [Durusdinium trenchii]|uniref:Uncharacterized protein n=1 Tax=Durusdinium trenchii TaxID=1381693 RepID=A0ABP0HQH7_9DINO